MTRGDKILNMADGCMFASWNVTTRMCSLTGSTSPMALTEAACKEACANSPACASAEWYAGEHCYLNTGGLSGNDIYGGLNCHRWIVYRLCINGRYCVHLIALESVFCSTRLFDSVVGKCAPILEFVRYLDRLLMCFSFVAH